MYVHVHTIIRKQAFALGNNVHTEAMSIHTRAHARTRTRTHTFFRLVSLSGVLSMTLMATSTPVRRCVASFTLAKLPFPIVCRQHDKVAYKDNERPKLGPLRTAAGGESARCRVWSQRGWDTREQSCPSGRVEEHLHKAGPCKVHANTVKPT